MNKSFGLTLLIGVLLSVFISSCNSNKYKPSEYSSATGVASPGVETKIELEDGAGIVIPADSIDQQVNVKVERNPEKAKSLQPLDEDFIQLSDFYNFEIEGNVNAPVDLILPFDAENIPDETGILVYAYPTDNGWEYIPVAPEGNKVRLYTTRIGDPIIAWHFVNPEKIEEILKDSKYCDPTIAVSVIPEQGGSTQDYKIVGRVEPLSQDITTKLGDKLASLILGQETSTFGNLPIEIIINNDPQKTISTRTHQDGSFEVTINPEKDSPLGFREKLNVLEVKTQCDSLFTSQTSLATGYSYFYMNPKEQTQATEPPVIEQPIEAPIPTGAVLLPDFIGQSIDNAIDWLEANGFKYTWIDGSSTYDLGMVYDQAPAGNQYKVPHRTVVVLYRTNNKIIDLCAGLNLTPEECANNGTHKYHRHHKTTFENNYLLQPYGGGGCAIYDKEEERTMNVVFANNTVDFYKGNIIHNKIEENIYYLKEIETSSYTLERKVVFTLGGFSEVITSTSPRPQFQFTHICENTITYTLIP